MGVPVCTCLAGNQQQAVCPDPRLTVQLQFRVCLPWGHPNVWWHPPLIWPKRHFTVGKGETLLLILFCFPTRNGSNAAFPMSFLHSLPALALGVAQPNRRLRFRV